jgi:replication-associated recombination protein RarA
MVEDTQQQCLMPLIIVNQNKMLAVIPKTSKGSHEQTQRGYYFDELLSALQKDIRRENEYEAVFWAVELDGYSPWKLWDRLRVMASEDIGVANPVAPLVVDVLRKEYCKARGLTEDMGKDRKGRIDDSYRLYLVHAVLFLVRSPKSRIVDDLLNVVYGEIQHEDKKLPMPDYALDMHTEEGTKMGRGFEHFFSEGAKLNNEAINNPYPERAKEILTKYGKLKPDTRNDTARTEQQTTLQVQ